MKIKKIIVNTFFVLTLLYLSMITAGQVIRVYRTYEYYKKCPTEEYSDVLKYYNKWYDMNYILYNGDPTNESNPLLFNELMARGILDRQVNRDPVE